MTLVLAGKRIGLLTASASRLGGGVFEAVAAQAAMLRTAGAEALVFALDDAHADEDRSRFAPSSVRLSPIVGAAQIGFASGLVRQLTAARLDCLHLHGIWMYPSRAAALWAKTSRKPYLISPHGMLDPWITARGKWKKALARAGYERASWRLASAFHALTPREAADIARETGRTDSLVIPNAGPPTAAPPTAPHKAKFLYLGRIHPKKNIAALIAAWSGLAAQGALPSEAHLTIAGWGEAEDVAALRGQLAAAPPSITFIGPCYGAAKERELRSAAFLILPSLSEGLPMVVLEAWAAGTPVLMTSECNLPEGFAAGAAADCGFTAATISAALSAALALPDARWLAMATAACKLATGRFAATSVAARWADAYSGLIAGNAGEIS